MRFRVAFLLALGSFGAVAQAQPPLPVAAIMPAVANLPTVEPGQIQLTPDAVKRFLASLPSVVALARQLDAEQGRHHPVRIDENLGVLLVPHLFVPRIAERVNLKLQSFGFKDYGEWADIAYSIGLAAEASDFTGSIDLAEQKEGLRRDIESDARLSADEKKAALEDIDRKFAALALSEPRPGNREAVAPFLQQLRAAATGG